MESTASFKSHHLRAGRAKSATTLEPELWVQRCELRVTVSQRTKDDNILCSVFCAPAQTTRVSFANPSTRGDGLAPSSLYAAGDAASCVSTRRRAPAPSRRHRARANAAGCDAARARLRRDLPPRAAPRRSRRL